MSRLEIVLEWGVGEDNLRLKIVSRDTPAAISIKTENSASSYMQNPTELERAVSWFALLSFHWICCIRLGEWKEAIHHLKLAQQQAALLPFKVQFRVKYVDCRHKSKRAIHRRRINSDANVPSIYSITPNCFLLQLTPFFSHTPPAFFRSPVQASPKVPISKSR